MKIFRHFKSLSFWRRALFSFVMLIIIGRILIAIVLCLPIVFGGPKEPLDDDSDILAIVALSDPQYSRTYELSKRLAELAENIDYQPIWKNDGEDRPKLPTEAALKGLNEDPVTGALEKFITDSETGRVFDRVPESEVFALKGFHEYSEFRNELLIDLVETGRGDEAFDMWERYSSLQQYLMEGGGVIGFLYVCQLMELDLEFVSKLISSDSMAFAANERLRAILKSQDDLAEKAGDFAFSRAYARSSALIARSLEKGIEEMGGGFKSKMVELGAGSLRVNRTRNDLGKRYRGFIESFSQPYVGSLESRARDFPRIDIPTKFLRLYFDGNLRGDILIAVDAPIYGELDIQFGERLTRNRLSQIALAIQADESSRGELCDTLQSLQPTYFDSIPVSPMESGTIEYRRNDREVVGSHAVGGEERSIVIRF